VREVFIHTLTQLLYPTFFNEPGLLDGSVASESGKFDLAYIYDYGHGMAADSLRVSRCTLLCPESRSLVPG
jgi:hypothetical protein